MGLDLPHTAGQECFIVGVVFDLLFQCSVLAVFSVKPTIPFLSYFSFVFCSAVRVGDQLQTHPIYIYIFFFASL